MVLNYIKRIWKDRAGVAYIEMALALPILLILLGNVIDLTRLIMLHQKVDSVTFTVGDLVTQLEGNNPCPLIRQVENNVARSILQPFAFNPGVFTMSVSSVLNTYPGSNTTAPPRDMIEWRYRVGFPSAIGGFSTPYQNVATLPASIRGLEGGERLIVTETIYRFTPLVAGISLLNARDVRAISYMRGRVTTGREGRGTGLLSGCS